MTPDAFQAPTLEELSPLFPNYSIDAFIAQGGMGAVYLATQTSLERQVAIKILPRELGADEEFRKSFAAEAKAMAKLNHPNLIGVYDFGEVDGMPFIVMEYVAGKPLHDSAYGKQIDPSEASRIVMETCRGLHHAHDHDILHRDVKPANILLDPRHAVPKLGDFGLAMATTDDSNDGLIYGTPGYAAPEVYEGNPDARSDVYAAAVILYQLITGQMPGNPYQHPSALAQCDRRYDALLAKALQPDASSRHQTADQFADEIEALQKAPTAASVVARPGISRRPIAPLASSRKSSSGPVIGAIAALLILGLGFFFLSSHKGEDEPSQSTDDTAALPREKPIPTPKALLEEKPIKRKPKPTPVKEPRMVEIEEPEKPRKRKRKEKEIAVVEEPTPTVTEAPAPASTFDHLAFLKRGRNYCAQKGEKILTDYREDLAKNIERLEREAKSILRDVDYIDNDDERARRNNIELTIKQFEETGRLPSDLVTNVPEGLSQITYRDSIVGKILREAIAEQNNIETELSSNLQPLAEIYAKGVEKQAEALSAEGNQYDADLLSREAEQARNDAPYFLKIARGEDPLPDALKSEPAYMSRKDLLLGAWKAEDHDTHFTFNEDGSCEGRSPSQAGSWKVEGEQIIVDWGPHKDLITIVPGDHNRFLADFRGKLVYFARIDEKPTKAGKGSVVGKWIVKRHPNVIFTFRQNGTATSGRWKGKGTWESTDAGYCITWNGEGDRKINFVVKDENTMEGTNKKDQTYTLLRQP